MTGASKPLRLACLDAEAPPLFSLWTPENGRTGYEPAVAEALGDELGRPVEWVRVPWVDMIPAVRRGDADAVLCGQGITAERLAQVDFTRPYAIFHEGVLVRRGAGIHTADDLVGRKVAAIENSTNMALVETFTGAVPVAFGPGSDDVYADMLAALSNNEVDAVVDDDVVFVPLGTTHPDYELAFTVRTANKWGIAVSKNRPDTLAEIDGALGRLIDSGRLRDVWKEWLPTLDYPFGDA
ncbi:glutamine-binding periplasmic protein [Mycolicibacterium mageritense DSM 44476 = CIP 104973]|uniref:Amino acid ABC transporter substrate-binding protein n=1 Tax=Mycolicibacterium mageritense TaxID=53462 RepID=A0ABM7HRY6_MYCME|nr:ABC transporter substrate-binding protein [Mycolicibacterium mageritense]MCC9179654.1 ABC transporter substrate-binding protein [Mycolicibacterium mageritense]BBX33317.1 amino acid ABC transporter substrate-binding protein [Mycolicibacterium mageritense]CDO21749.1 glutamine-binding periplasmic protein [Mycolicibacterium mageritense DSM 44476 = CIP 104973]